MAMSETNSDEAPRRGMPLWVQLIVWAGLIVLLVVLALGLKKNQQGSVQIGETTPDFTLKLFDGYRYLDKNEIALSDLRGKVVVINFWASWCIPCADEAPILEAAWKSYQPAGQVVFLGVDYIDTPTEALAYLEKFNISYATGPDLETLISPMFRITGVPETYVIDQSGKLAYAWVSPFESEAQIHAIVDPLINP
jgi:cytochrome c biogenesis protein CcmG, thiol:disulfide interchange protein DsbE